MVSNTYTLNDWFGSGVTATGTGILLNNEMDDFTSQPGVPNDYGLIQSEANAIAPKKRPLSSMTPTIVLEGRQSRCWQSARRRAAHHHHGAARSSVNVIDFGMNMQEAIDAPRIHHQWLPDEILLGAAAA